MSAPYKKATHNVPTKVPYTKVQIILEVLCLFMLFAMLLHIVVSWSTLPDQIPTHYDFKGEINAWGGKSSILFLPCIGLGVYILITVSSFFPKIWNMPCKIKKGNEAKAYQSTKTFLLLTKGEVLAVFLFLNIYSVTAAPLPIWFLPVFLVIIFGTIILFIIRIVKDSKA